MRKRLGGLPPKVDNVTLQRVIFTRSFRYRRSYGTVAVKTTMRLNLVPSIWTP